MGDMGRNATVPSDREEVEGEGDEKLEMEEEEQCDSVYHSWDYEEVPVPVVETDNSIVATYKGTNHFITKYIF